MLSIYTMFVLTLIVVSISLFWKHITMPQSLRLRCSRKTVYSIILTFSAYTLPLLSFRLIVVGFRRIKFYPIEKSHSLYTKKYHVMEITDCLLPTKRKYLMILIFNKKRGVTQYLSYLIFISLLNSFLEWYNIVDIILNILKSTSFFDGKSF